MNNIHKYLEFKLTEEEIKNKLSRSIHTQRQQQPPTRDLQKIHTDRHYCPLHIQPPLGHKLAAYNFYINRMIFTPITKQARQQEWGSICTIARNNGFPLPIIHNLKNKIIRTQKTKKKIFPHKHKEMDHIYVS